ncbi:MAG: hypothetical protein IJQ95_03670 [Paludibacteraceae bacterium]|nr:hypothetical protein [Paludibacteraceae bacterium]
MSLKSTLKELEKERPSYVVEGWVAKDGWHHHPCESQTHFFIDKPTRLERPGSGLEIWNGQGYQIALPDDAFPKLRYSDEPVKVRIEIYRTTGIRCRDNKQSKRKEIWKR